MAPQKVKARSWSSLGLQKQPLFQGVEARALDALASKGELRSIPAGTALNFLPGVLYVVEEGALELSIGFGPATLARPGYVLNAAGMLGLGATIGLRLGSSVDESGHTLQSQQVDGPAYEVLSNVASFEHLAKWRANAVGTAQIPCFEESGCLARLCPEAQVLRSSSRSAAAANGRPHSTPERAARTHKLEVRAASGRGAAQCAHVRCLSLNAFSSQAHTQQRMLTNAEELLGRAEALLRCGLLPGAPQEVIWSLAELAEPVCVEAGQRLVAEGEAGGALLVVAKGEATVEKTVGELEKAVGRLRPGAVLGGLSLVGVTVPRAASVVADTQVLALVLPAPAVLGVFRRFPGLCASMVHRLAQTTRQLQAALPPRSELLSSVKAFSWCEPRFLNALARECERLVFYWGTVIREQGGNDGSLFIVQHGACALDDKEGTEVSLGGCFGHGTPVGSFETSPCAVWAVTPIVVILKLGKNALAAVLARFPGEAMRVHQRDMMVPPGSTLRHIISRIEIFTSCGQRFLEEVEKACGVMYYMPNQTLCVEGSVDEAHMFFLRGGQAAVELHGHKGSIILQVGSSFGERAFLGIVRRRTATIRAVTMCVTVECSRASVLTILERFPKERQLFEQLAMQGMSATDGIRWPILRDATPQLCFMLNLVTERRVLAKEDFRIGDFMANDAAVLLMHGSLAVVDAAGSEVELLAPGSCFNEQILVDVPPAPDVCYMPKTGCEVQVLRKDVWEQVIASFPQEEEKVRHCIVKVMATKAEERLGHAPGSTGVLLNSALFRTVPASFAEGLRPHLEERMCQPGESIIEDGAEGDFMCILLDGEATAKSRGSPSPLLLPVGRAFGEAVLLGATKTYDSTVQAISYCLLYTLHKCHWDHMLEEHPEEWQLFEGVLREAGQQDYGDLQARLQRSPTFSGADSRFLEMALRHASHTFFAPGERICSASQSKSFVLLAGMVTIRDKLGFILSEVKPGEMFGEAGCLGLKEQHVAFVDAAKQGLAHCIELHEESMKAALLAFPTECQTLQERFHERQEVHRSSIDSRHRWLSTCVLPVLRCSSVFANYRDECLYNVAGGLSPANYESGDTIASAGVPSDAMSFLLEGSADVITRDGRTVGSLRKGAWFDEVVALGLFRLHIATVRATSSCSVLAVPTKAILDAEAADPETPALFQALREGRKTQVTQALPISALPLQVALDDVAARAVALQAERLDLLPGQRLAPLPDASPCGPHFLVVVRGRASVEIAHSGHPVQNIARGTPISEGLAAEHGALVRATTACEAYRVRHSDFRVAVGADVKWLGDFMNLERECWEALRTRLSSAKGVGRISRTPNKQPGTTRPVTPEAAFYLGGAVPGFPLFDPMLVDEAMRQGEARPLSSGEQSRQGLPNLQNSLYQARPNSSSDMVRHSLPNLHSSMHQAPLSFATFEVLDKHPTLRPSCSAGRLASVRRHQEHMAGIRSILQMRKGAWSGP